MERLNIIKIGGNVIDDPKVLSKFLNEFAALEGLKLLVHGGGKVATQIAKSMQLKTEMMDGRRITDDKMIDVVTMTYGGLINKKIVSELQSLGVNAVGLTGADGNLILSEKRPIKDHVDYGWVGDPKEVNRVWLSRLLNEEQVLVVAPLTHDGKGNLLNTNADTIANVLGVAMSSYFETSINYCFDLPGVLQDVKNSTSLIKNIQFEEYEQLKEKGIISNGMIPKLDNAFKAIDSGVKSVRIMHHESISRLQNKHFDEYTTIH